MHELTLKLHDLFSTQFSVVSGVIYRKVKGSNKLGKTVPQIEAMGVLVKASQHYASTNLATQTLILSQLIGMANETPDDAPPEEDENCIIEEVDQWAVPLLKVFRWRSDGKVLHHYYWPGYAKALLDGDNDPEGPHVPKTLVLTADAEKNGFAIMLMSMPDLWKRFEELYLAACNDASVRVSPKVSKDGVKVYHTFKNYLQLMVQPWLSDVRFNIAATPKNLSNNCKEWAFWHFEGESLPEDLLPTPNWDGWTSKIVGASSREVFKAWIASIFVAKNSSRQVLWIEDNGGGGKGTLATVLETVIGDGGYAAMSANSLESEFGAEAFYGKRLLVHPDNKNPRILSTALVHQITGGDSIYINRKNEKSVTASMRGVKVCIAANCSPEADMYNFHEASRLCHIKLDPKNPGADRSHLIETKHGVQLKGDVGFKDRLVKEFPAFLAKCFDSYAELCPHHGNIIIPQDVIERTMAVCASTEQEHFEEFFEDNFEAVHGKMLTARTLKEVFATYPGKQGPIGLGAFKKFMASKGITTAQIGKKRVRSYLNIRARNTEGEDYNDHEIIR